MTSFLCKDKNVFTENLVLERNRNAAHILKLPKSAKLLLTSKYKTLILLFRLFDLLSFCLFAFSSFCHMSQKSLFVSKRPREGIELPEQLKTNIFTENFS